MNEFVDGFKFEERGLSAVSPVKYDIRTFKSDEYIRLHYHNSLEINICRRLKGFIRIGGTAQSLSPDCLVVIPPDTPHSYLLNNCSGTIEVFHILPDSIPGASAAIEDTLETLKIPLNECSSMITTHLNEMRILDSENKMLFLGHLLLFLGELERIKQRSKWIGWSNSLPVGSFLRRIIDYTEANYQEKISLNDISSYSGVSKYHFCRMFKKETGETWSKYLRNVRLSNSLNNLREGMSVAEAAVSCGFESDSYFIKCFKDEYFKTPVQWVKNEQKILIEDERCLIQK